MTMADTTNSQRTKSNYWNRAKQIKNTTNSWKAMELGKVSTNDNWKRIKIDVMKVVLIEKYAQCDVYKRYLQDTSNKQIVEDTRNEFWGRGCNGDGLNVLGNLHQSVRENYKDRNPTPYQQRIPGSYQ